LTTWASATNIRSRCWRHLLTVSRISPAQLLVSHLTYVPLGWKCYFVQNCQIFIVLFSSILWCLICINKFWAHVLNTVHLVDMSSFGLHRWRWCDLWCSVRSDAWSYVRCARRCRGWRDTDASLSTSPSAVWFVVTANSNVAGASEKGREASNACSVRSKVSVDLYSTLSWLISKVLRYGTC